MLNAASPMRTGPLVGLLIACAFAPSVAARRADADARPNIVILLADNLGYDDVGTFHTSFVDASGRRHGSRTARTDALADEGMKFLNWNSPAVLCSASRAALMTGRYPVRTGVYPRVFEPDAELGLLANETTIADHLRKEGYISKIVGKWHLGSRPGFLPTDRGFDEWFGIPYVSIFNYACMQALLH